MTSAPATGALDALYKDVILEHRDCPRGYGALPDANLRHEGFNPLCGDEVRLAALVGPSPEFKIEKLRFEGKGCAICMASASILMEDAEGQSQATILQKIQDFRDLMQGKKEPSDFKGDAGALAGVRAFPVRIKCALLPWTTLKEAFEGAGNPSTTEAV